MSNIAGIVTSGLVSGTVYLVAQAIDVAITGYRTDDNLLVGALLPVGPSNQKTIGTAGHLANSVLFAAAFRALGRDRLPGPMWLRGLTFALGETIALYPMAMFERYHPAIRDGRLPSYLARVAFGQQFWRHTALGLTLGALTPKRD